MEKLKSESSERSFDESELVSSQSDIQLEITMDDDNGEIKSPEVSLTEKLSAALANVSAKDDLVKQHVKVAEEAVAGWEKAENEVIELKKKLEATDNKNSVLEDRVSHLDDALKECVRQLRQAKDEQDQRIQDIVTEKTHEFQSTKTCLENQILEASRKTNELSLMAESVAKENVMLRHELLARCEELEIRTIERDLSTQAAETASKQQLDSIKKVAKLESECRKLRMLVAKSSASFTDHRSMDSHSDGGERMDISCSESWTSSTLIEKRTCSSIEIDLMGDFLEMERLVALPCKNGPEPVTEETGVHIERSLHGEIEVLTRRIKQLEEKLKTLQEEKDEVESEVREVERAMGLEIEAIVCDKMELENKLEKMEVEKAELHISFDIIKEKYKESQVCLQEIQKKMEVKAKIESKIIDMEAEAHAKTIKIESLEEDVRKEKYAYDELRRKCEVLEEEVNAIKRETIEPKIKQEDIETAAGKLENCQKTIASLGKQLQSLATLEDFLIDTTSIPVDTNGVRNSNIESWKAHKNQTFMARNHQQTKETSSSEKNRNGFAKVFTRSKDGIHLVI